MTSLHDTAAPNFIREHVSCALCGGDQTRVKYQVNTRQTVWSRVWIGETGYDLAGQETLVQCRRCGLVFVNPRLAPVAGLLPYSPAQELAYFTKTRDLRWRAYSEMWELVPDWLGRRPASMLDIGCGDGLLMEIARAKGTDTMGVEVSEPLMAMVRERLGAGAVVAGQPGQLPAASFDVVALINVLEHLHNPRQMLQDVARLVRPGGLVLVHVPNLGGLPSRLAGGRWHQIEPLVHYYYFTTRTLTQMLAQHDFRVAGRFSLVVAGARLGRLQRLAGRLGLYLDSGLGLVARGSNN